ncbi:MAG: GcrA family cell cycle regulator [Pelagibacteraceae bacterium]
MSTTHKLPWTDALAAELTKLWDKGLSAREIAEALNLPSRNMIIGKAHRLGLPKRQSPIIYMGERKRQALRKLAKGRKEIKREAKQARVRLPTFGTTGSASTCQWIHGEPRERNFCGVQSIAGHSWCAEHYSRVFLPT